MSALKGLKVLDFSTLLPGPFATMYLADWGAEVLRVEAPDREDLARTMPPFANGMSTTHAFLGRNKACISLDLRDPVAQARIKELVQDYDIVVEQFRPGVMAKFGLDYKSLQAVNPRLIYCSLTGYGQTGPYRDRAGHDINYAALTGIAAMTGSRTDGPILHGTPVCDLAGSFHAVIGILMAVLHRQRTGDGQYLDVSIADSSLMLSALWAPMALAAGLKPGWESTVLNGGSFYGYYRTRDGEYLSVGGLEPKFVKGFFEAIGALDLLPLAARLGQDPAAGARLRSGIQERLSTRTRAEWLAILTPLDVCAEPVLRFDDAMRHPQTRERGMVVEVPVADGQTQEQLGSPLHFSTLRPEFRHAGLGKGHDNVRFGLPKADV